LGNLAGAGASATGAGAAFFPPQARNGTAAKAIGTLIAERAIKAGIKEVVFDRGGYIYHGRIKELAEAAREAGLSF